MVAIALHVAAGDFIGTLKLSATSASQRTPIEPDSVIRKFFRVDGEQRTLVCSCGAKSFARDGNFVPEYRPVADGGLRGRFVSEESEDAYLLRRGGEPPRTRTWNPLIIPHI